MPFSASFLKQNLHQFDLSIKPNQFLKFCYRASQAKLALDKPPFRAYPVTGGITFTYGGLKISKNGNVLDQNDQSIEGLYACGELVGGVFLNGYPGGSGLTSGAVFGRKAGSAAALGL